MRAFFRLVSSAITFVFLALMVLTTETVATELGFVSQIRAVVRGSWRSVTDSGYVTTLYAGFWLSLGVAATLWADYFVKKSRAKSAERSMAIFDLRNDPDRMLVDDLRAEFATITKTAEGSHFVDIQFTDPKPRYIVVVVSDAPAVWTELIKTERFLRLEIWPEKEGEEITAISITARPFEADYDMDNITQAREKQTAFMNERYPVLRTKGVARSLQWQ